LSFAIAIVVVGRRCVVAVVEDKIQKIFQFNGMEWNGMEWNGMEWNGIMESWNHGIKKC
jgi:hypothetical protein